MICPLQDAGAYSFSVGVSEVLNSNLLGELSADDIECLSKVLMTFMPLIHKLHMGFSSNKSYSWVYVARTQPYFKNQILFQFKICFHMI
jgi:hypothetical protein